MSYTTTVTTAAPATLDAQTAAGSLPVIARKLDALPCDKTAPAGPLHHRPDAFEPEAPGAGGGDEPPSVGTMTSEMKKKENIYFAAACMAVFLLGWNDASSGPLLPRMQDSYHVGFVIVSMIFVLNCVGFLSAALMNVWLTDRLGFGGVVTLGSIVQLIAYIIESPQPPFALLVVAYGMNGFGMGLQNAQVNGFVASLPTNPSGKMSFLHGIYGFGALAAPLVATQFSQRKKWSFHYITSLGISLIITATHLFVFRLRSQEALLADIGVVNADEPVALSPPGSTSATPAPVPQNRSKFGEIMRLKSVHLIALFVFVYVGVEVTIGGWMVTFVQERRGGGSSAGYISTGFFAGLALGRMLLIKVNRMIGEGLAVYVYGALAIGLELTIWLVPSLLENAIAVAFVGVFLGPIYPIVMNFASALIPRKLLIGSIGWIASIGQTGSAAFPFILAIMAQKHGVQVLQPLLIAMIGFMSCVWFWVPSTKRRTD